MNEKKNVLVLICAYFFCTNVINNFRKRALYAIKTIASLAFPICIIKETVMTLSWSQKRKKWTRALGNFRQQDCWYFSTASTPKLGQWLHLVRALLNNLKKSWQYVEFETSQSSWHPTLGSFCFTGEPQRSLLHLVPP